jgi:hypothetical protein
MGHLLGTDRSQMLLLPEVVDDNVGPENPVRFIEAFVDGLDLQVCGFSGPSADQPNPKFKLRHYPLFVSYRIADFTVDRKIILRRRAGGAGRRCRRSWFPGFNWTTATSLADHEALSAMQALSSAGIEMLGPPFYMPAFRFLRPMNRASCAGRLTSAKSPFEDAAQDSLIWFRPSHRNGD